MKSKEISQVKHILSSNLHKGARVIDMLCGDSYYSEWLNETNKVKLLPMSPKEMEHISHENPFVAYNNFINDDRMIPVEDTRADAVLLLGPLYSLQSPDKRVETIKEVKRLIKDTGVLFTISNYTPYMQNSQNPQFSAVDKTETDVLLEAGFVVENTFKLAPVNALKTIRYKSIPVAKNNFNNHISNQRCLTIAKIKPAISRDAIPPQVILQIPKDILDSLNIERTADKKADNRENYNSDIEIKPSIDTSLQKKNVIHKSIDPLLQRENLPKENSQKENSLKMQMTLPVLPREILDIYENPNNSVEENNTSNITDTNRKDFDLQDNKEDDTSAQKEHLEISDIEREQIQKIPVKPSIDENLVVRPNKNEIIRKHLGIEDFAKVHDSIDKSLQIKIPKINPRYAKPKSRKKGAKNLFKNEIRG